MSRLKLTINLTGITGKLKKLTAEQIKLKRAAIKIPEELKRFSWFSKHDPEEAIKSAIISKIEAASGCTRNEIIELQERLGISLESILEFYKALGFLPSEGYSIGIRHLGVPLVVECIRENQANKL